MKKACIVCGEEFVGRSDKKFCSAYCRTTFYNRSNSDVSNYMRKINNRLRKNRRILARLNPQGKVKIHRAKLLEAGFMFEFFTNTYETHNGHVYYFCYEQGYLLLEGGYVALVKRKEQLV